MTGTLGLNASPPITLPSGTSGYVLTTDSLGNVTAQPPAGGGGGVTLTPVSKSGAYTASAAEFVVCNATSASFTVTLPTAPADKSIVGVKMTATASAHTVSVATGGSDVFNVASGATSLTLSLLMQGLICQYQSSTGIWFVTGDDLPLGQLDARYTQLAGDLGNTTASPQVTGIHGTAIDAPNGGATNFLNAAGHWTAPSGGGGGMSNPMSALGDTIYGGASGTPTDLAGNTTTTRKFYRQTGTGSASAAPAWDTLQTGDLPSGTALLSGGAAGAFSGALSTSASFAAGVASLADASTILVNAALGCTFRVTLGGNRTLANPTNPTDGQRIIFEITQDSTGSRTLSFGSAYIFGTTVTSPTLSTSPGTVDVLGFAFVGGSVNRWRCLAVALGYGS